MKRERESGKERERVCSFQLVQHSNLVCSFSDVMCSVSESAGRLTPSNLSAFAPIDQDAQVLIDCNDLLIH